MAGRIYSFHDRFIETSEKIKLLFQSNQATPRQVRISVFYLEPFRPSVSGFSSFSRVPVFDSPHGMIMRREQH
jgi:hypothetical protein